MGGDEERRIGGHPGWKRAHLYEEVTWMPEYHESLLRHMESGVVAASCDGFSTMINDAGARMIGVAPTEVVGGPATELIPCGLGVPFLDTLTGKATYTDYEALLTSSAGRSLPIVLSTYPSRGRGSEPAGAVLAFNDFSRLRALEEEKRRIGRLASIGAAISGIAHEIKNALVALKTFAELLPERYADAEFRETFAKVVLHEVDGIDTLVQRLKSLSSRPPVPLCPANVIAPLEEALSLLSGELTRRKIGVTCEYRQPLSPIMGGHDQLKQVFVNLFLNSIKAMGRGGTLKITVGSESQPATLMVQIADTGTGIPAEYLSSVFDPFLTLKEQGTGLGLAICRGIIESHRGSISAANHPDGSGALFTVTLPAVQGEAAHEVSAPGG